MDELLKVVPEPIGYLAVVMALIFASWKIKLWDFVKAAARVPLIIENVAKEFSKNGGESLRDAIDANRDATAAVLDEQAALKLELRSIKDSTLGVLEERVGVLEVGHSELTKRVERAENRQDAQESRATSIDHRLDTLQGSR